MYISFVGAGYVGLVSSILFTHLGHNVCSIDNNEQKITDLKNGIIPIYEPKLDEYLKQSLSKNQIEFSNKHKSSNDISAIFIAVGTPPLESGEADLSYIYEATLEAAKTSNDSTLIIIKSTVPPSTCSQLQSFLKENGYNHEIASNPEFLREGSAIEDFLHPDRIIIGTSSDRASNILKAIYKPLTDQGSNLIQTDLNTAELIKYASNSFLATKIGFINEMANLCESIGADIDALSKGMGSDKRIGKDFLKAGPGFGGSCFPKDIMALSYLSHKIGKKCEILDSVISSNKNRKEYIVKKISNILGSIENKTICILGITFKAYTDDVRSSPAIEIAKLLQHRGANITIYDPEGMKNASIELNANFCNSAYEAAKDSSAIVILTEWNEFRELDFYRLSNTVKEKIIFDFRNILSTEKISQYGFTHYKIGKPFVNTNRNAPIK